MPEVGLFEAKTHLSKLVEDIETGRETEIVLTRRGKPVARLSPIYDPTAIDTAKRELPSEIFTRIRKNTNLNGMTIRELIESGRRF